MSSLPQTPPIRLVITDLDNTLYDWVAWYAGALHAMVERASAVLAVDPERLLDELEAAYALRGSVEEPRALLELPCVRERFPERRSAGEALEPALDAFVHPPAGALRAYPGVRPTLARLREIGVPVVGHTEATAANAVRRLRLLGLESSLVALFAGHRRADDRDPLPGAINPPPPFSLQQLGPELAKPDPGTVHEICRRMGVAPAEVLYVGDNLERDVAMARRAGAWAVWARFGTRHDSQDWQRLVRVTHWTDDEIRRAENPKPRSGDMPHVTLERDLAEVFEHFAFEPESAPDDAPRDSSCRESA